MSLDTETHHRIDVLEREIAQKNVELQGLLERIRELDGVKSQFLENVSHALHTPLGLILGPAQRLADDDGVTLDLAQRRDNAQIITRNARLLLKHVNDLLDMSQLEAGKLKLDLRDTDLAALLRQLGEHFAPLAAECNIDYAIDVPHRCFAATDPDKLLRAVMNLLGNAFRFTPRDGRVRCSLVQQQGEVTIAIDDSGPGVPPQMREAIFERFRQGGRSGTRKTAGKGLGLAIAKEFVEMHHGRIAVRDSALGGARFEVTIPRRLATDGMPHAPTPPTLDGGMVAGVLEELRLARPQRPDHGADAATADGDRSRARVLVIEDNPDLNHFVSQCLAADYDVCSAFDGREGIEKALRLRPTLIVTDVMLPDCAGSELIDEIRKRPELALVPILLLSGKLDEPLMSKLLDDGAQDYIVEPFAQKDLHVRVRNLVLAQQAREQVDGLRLAADSANRAKDEFLAMLGHELRNPLSPILTAVQLMKVQGPKTAERASTVIERQVHHLIHLVDDLIDVARITRGQMELRKQPMELAEAVNIAIASAGPMLEQRAHTLRVEVPPHGLLLDADPARLAQVITNLLTNAAKYTPPGGRVDVAAWTEGGDVALSVRDSGIGIAPAVLPHIFDRFVQMPQTIDRSLGGLGLGLTIVRHLIERHGGSVEARSDGENRGSEFIVRLPRAERDQGAAAGDAAADAQARAEAARRRVLVVDDNEDGAVMLSTALQLHGFDVREARDGVDALRVAAEFRPEIALLDIGLPGMDGYELARRLRAMPALGRIRLIALTGYGQASDREKARAAGFDHHMVKPVAIDELESLMRR